MEICLTHFRKEQKEIEPSTHLDDFLPAYDFNEIHSITVHAPPNRVFRAIKELTPAELSPWVHILFALRALPARLIGKNETRLDSTKPIVEQVLDISFILLAEETNREIVLGTIGKFWQATSRSDRKPAKDAEEFLAFDQPGFAKAAMNFHIADDPRDCVAVTTETRIYAADARTRAIFAAYWRLIHSGSALIRMMWLKAIKRRAERG